VNAAEAAAASTIGERRPIAAGPCLVDRRAANSV
jgi:hypothetical protein